MSEALFNIDLLGDKKLQKQLNKLMAKDQKKAVNQGLKKATAMVRTVTRQQVKSSGSGTGASAKAIKSYKIKAKGRRGFVGWRVASGTREDIVKHGGDPKILYKKTTGKSGKKQGYYPAHMEYGYSGRSGTGAMERAFKMSYPRAITVLRQEMRNFVRKVMKR